MSTADQIDAAVKVAAHHFNVGYRDIISQNRRLPIATARQMAIWLARECYGISHQKIADRLQRKRTVIWHNLHRFRHLMLHSHSLRWQANALAHALKTNQVERLKGPLLSDGRISYEMTLLDLAREARMHLHHSWPGKARPTKSQIAGSHENSVF